MSQDSDEHARVWRDVMGALAPTLTSQQRAWLSLTDLVGMIGTTALLSTPTPFARDMIERSLRDPITSALADRLALPITLAVTVTEPTDTAATGSGSEGASGPGTPILGPAGSASTQLARIGGVNGRDPGRTFGGPSAAELAAGPGAAANGTASTPSPAAHYSTTAQHDMSGLGGSTRGAPDDADLDDEDETASAIATVTEIWPQVALRRDAAPQGSSQTRLNSKYHFETFVIGSSNRFAHAAAVAVAESPAVAYNPLFIWGESGLGKTHLLHGIGHYAQRLFPGVRVRYVSSEEFTNDFINSLRDDRKVAFQRRYRDVDVLLVDDFQFLEV